MHTAGPHAEQQWTFGIPELLADLAAEPIEVVPDLVLETVRSPVASDVAPRIDADHESGWDREVEGRHHVAQVRTLLPEQLLQLVERELVRMIEGVDTRHDAETTGQPRRSASHPITSVIGSLTCSIESRSRMVTAWSSRESKSKVTQYGVPISSCRR